MPVCVSELSSQFSLITFTILRGCLSQGQRGFERKHTPFSDGSNSDENNL